VTPNSPKEALAQKKKKGGKKSLGGSFPLKREKMGVLGGLGEIEHRKGLGESKKNTAKVKKKVIKEPFGAEGNGLRAKRREPRRKEIIKTSASEQRGGEQGVRGENPRILSRRENRGEGEIRETENGGDLFSKSRVRVEGMQDGKKEN